MATILLLKPQTSRTPPAALSDKRTSGTTAEIIFFPGVRYERWQEPATVSRETPKRRRRARVKRDRMTIIL